LPDEKYQMVGIMFSTEGFQRFGVRIHTYVLMPNNYHLQLELGSRLSLSAAMHGLNTGYGIWFKRRYRGQGACFRGGSKSAGKRFGVVSWEEIVLQWRKSGAGHGLNSGPVAITMRGQSQSGSPGAELE
jgi:hypothetical protein